MPVADEPELLPCPFCSSSTAPYVHPTRVENWFGVTCDDERAGCGACIIADGRDQAVALWNTRAAPPAMDREAVVLLKDGDEDPYSFSGDEDENGFVISQHRFYKWGDDCIIAVGELNTPNTWDNEAFDAKCQTILSTLSADAIRQGEGEADRGVATSVDDERTRAFIDGWNARFDHTDFDMALHYWMLSGVTLTPASHASDGGKA